MFLNNFFESWAASLQRFPVLGVDFSDLSIKFLRFDQSGNSLSIKYIGNVPLPAGIVVNGTIEKPGELVSALKDLHSLDGRSARERFVVASLPEEKGFIQMLRIPKIKAENLDAAVRWELEGVIPLPAEEIYFDYEALPMNNQSDHVDVLVLAYPRVLVDSYVSVLHEAGFTPLALELESQAIVRSLILPTNREPILIIDLGTTRTSFVLVSNGGIIHTSTISISGALFEERIQKELGVSAERSRELKVEVGLDTEKEEGKVAHALSGPLQSLMEEILRHLDFFRDHVVDRGGTNLRVDRIVLTGGDSNLLGLDSFIARGVKVHVEKWNPFALVLPRMERALPPVPANKAHQYTTAIGLALRGILE